LLLLLATSCSSSSGTGSAGPTPDAGPGDGAPRDAKSDAPAPPGQWSCLGQVSLDLPTKPTLTWQLQPLDALSGATFGNLQVQECSMMDVTCSPALFIGVTDPTTGIATVSAVASTNGFDGFWEFQASGYVPSLVFSNVPIINDAQIATGPAWNTSDLKTALGTLGSGWDMTKGIVAFQAFDCNSPALHQNYTLTAKQLAGTLAMGVTMSIDPSGGTASYLAGKTYSTSAMQTDKSGQGVIVDVPEGWVTLTATLAATGQKIGTGRVYAKAGAVSSITMSPSP
jgi:hypothetical protein